MASQNGHTETAKALVAAGALAQRPPQQTLQAQLKWLLEQVHMVRTTSHHAGIVPWSTSALLEKRTTYAHNTDSLDLTIYYPDRNM